MSKASRPPFDVFSFVEDMRQRVTQGQTPISLAIFNVQAQIEDFYTAEQQGSLGRYFPVVPAETQDQGDAEEFVEGNGKRFDLPQSFSDGRTEAVESAREKLLKESVFVLKENLDHLRTIEPPAQDPSDNAGQESHLHRERVQWLQSDTDFYRLWSKLEKLGYIPEKKQAMIRRMFIRKDGTDFPPDISSITAKTNMTPGPELMGVIRSLKGK